MEAKRLSTQGRVATPKAVAATGLDLDAALTKAVGGRVRIITHPSPNTPSSLEGILFAYDSSLRLAALTTSSKIAASQPSEFRLLPLGAVASVTPLGNDSFDDDINSLVSSTRSDPEALKKREDAAVQSLKAIESTRNRGATKEGQAIFDWFSRSLPTYWSNNSIIVNNSVRVDPPYRLEDCKAPKDKKSAETHIRKVLSGYYEKNGGNPGVNKVPAVVPALPRKGG